MAFKSFSVALATSNTDVVVCPATQQGAAVIAISNITAGALTYALKLYRQATGLTVTLATGVSVAANTVVKFPAPISLEAGDKIIMTSSSASNLLATGTFTYSAATPAAVGFNPTGAWDSGATYAVNDLVSKNFNSYVAIQESTNQDPETQTAYWMLSAGRGATGSGDLTAANNLSDLADKRAAFDNLHLHGADVASAGTLDLSATTGDLVDVTGTTSITAITLAEGKERTLRFTGAATLTHGASLVVPGGTRVMAAGDIVMVRGYAAGVVRVVGLVPISLQATTTLLGQVVKATSAQVYAAVADKFVAADNIEAAAAGVALVDAATVAVDWDAGINFTLTVTANRIIGNPTNGQPGTTRTILAQANNTTDRTLTFGNQYLGDVPVITDCDDTRWYLLSIFCVTTTHFVVSKKRAK